MPNGRTRPPKSALILIDMVNALDFEGGEALLRNALEPACRMRNLTRRLKGARLPVIYANDNYGQWRSNFREVISHCTSTDGRGGRLLEGLYPEQNDFFVLKPMHSAFHQTPLRRLLDDLGIDTLVLAGIATDSCVLATAIDAHMHQYRVFVPPDCTASETSDRHRAALKLLKETIGVDTRQSHRITLPMLTATRGKTA